MRIRNLNYALFSAIPLLIGMATPLAYADTITDASFFIVASNGNAQNPVFCGTSLPCAGSGPTSGSVGLIVPASGYPGNPNGSPYSGSSFATVSNSPSPSISVSAAATAAELLPAGPDYDPFTMGASGTLTYYFEMMQTAGPPSSDAVPVLMEGSSTLFSQAGSTDDITSSSISMSVAAADGSSTLYTLPGANVGGFSQVLGILPDVEYEVTMAASAAVQVSATEDTNPDLSASAGIDPVFTISPDFAADYQLDFSNAIGNSASATPEPATWAMMLIGFAGLGAAGLKR